MRLSLFLPLIFLALPVSLAADAKPNPVFEQALALKKEGRLGQAEAKLKEALQGDPSNPDVHFELANVLAMRYDDRRAENPEVKKMLKSMARELEQAIMARSDFLAAHYNLGVVYKRQKEFEKAREEFREVLKLDPTSLPAEMQLGAAYEDQGFFEEAKKGYERAREMDLNNPNIAAALEDLKRHEELAKRENQPALPPSFTHFRDALANPNGQRYDGQQEASGNFKQAIPYLGSLLLQEFMKRRGGDKDP